MALPLDFDCPPLSLQLSSAGLFRHLQPGQLISRAGVEDLMRKIKKM